MTTMFASIRPLSDSIFKIRIFESTFNCGSVLFYYFLMRIRFIFMRFGSLLPKEWLISVPRQRPLSLLWNERMWIVFVCVCVRRLLARKATLSPSPFAYGKTHLNTTFKLNPFGICMQTPIPFSTYIVLRATEHNGNRIRAERRSKKNVKCHILHSVRARK